MVHIGKIILASGSPRRSGLLNNLGVEYETVIPQVDETVFSGMPPAEQVSGLSRIKALSVSLRGAGLPVVAADTLVALDGRVLGKPSDREEAFEMLRALSGRWHEVFTGVTVAEGDRVITEYEVTQVKFRELADEEIDAYIATGEPMDKAGAYGIQEKGALLVERINGDFYNVVGFPLVRLAGMLRELGCRLTD